MLTISGTIDASGTIGTYVTDTKYTLNTLTVAAAVFGQQDGDAVKLVDLHAL